MDKSLIQAISNSIDDRPIYYYTVVYIKSNIRFVLSVFENPVDTNVRS